MTEANTQPVVNETETAPLAAVEDTGAQTNELASFLDDYEKQTSLVQPNRTPEAKPETADPLLQQLQSKIESLEQRDVIAKNKADQENVMKQIKGDIDAPSWFVEGWLSAKAKESPLVDKIWNERDINPVAAKKMVAGMVKEFAKEASKFIGKPIDADATGDRAAVAAAVRGSSTRAPESQPPKLGNLTNHEFNEYVKANHGYHPGV